MMANGSGDGGRSGGVDRPPHARLAKKGGRSQDGARGWWRGASGGLAVLIVATAGLGVSAPAPSGRLVAVIMPVERVAPLQHNCETCGNVTQPAVTEPITGTILRRTSLTAPVSVESDFPRAASIAALGESHGAECVGGRVGCAGEHRGRNRPNRVRYFDPWRPDRARSCAGRLGRRAETCLRHAATSSGLTGGRSTSLGHLAPSGQLADSQRMAFSNRRV